MSKTLPMVKQKVMTMIKPSEPLTLAAHTMALGSTMEASLISSDMCTAESAPIRVYTGDNRPTIKARPVLLHPPRFKKPVNTSEAELRGAKTQRGMRTAKKPRIWIISTIPSTMGSRFARKVLKMMQNAVMAITRRVPCHCSKM